MDNAGMVSETICYRRIVLTKWDYTELYSL